ncbi:MAG: VOC family protein [Candidatus Binataceae bacterium]
MSASADALAPHLYQISYLTRNMDATQEWFKRVMGVRHFGTFETFLGPDYNFRMRGKTHPGIKIKVAMARVGARGEYELEIIEPEKGDNIYSEFLDKYGPGLHHAAYVVPDFDRAAASVRAAGMQVLIEFENAGAKGAYFDLSPAGGSVIEIVQYNQETAEGLEALKTPPAGTADDSDALAPHFFQVAYLARDFNRVVDFFKRAIGVEQFVELDLALGPPDHIKVKGAAVMHPFRQMVAMGPAGKNGENEIEIIAPSGKENIYSEMIEERGPGIHHISCRVPDFDKFAARLRANGIKPVIELELPSFKGAYFDCRTGGASYIEVAEYRG